MAHLGDLSGRRVLVTGAGQGVGLAIAGAFAATGAHVLVNDLDPGRAASAVEQLAASGGAATASAFDVTDADAVDAAVTEAGHVDVLVNNAGNAGADGFGVRGPFAESDARDWEPFVRVNLYGPMHCSRAVLPGMVRAGWGRLITIVSDAARNGDPGNAAYSAAKAGAAGLTRALARENGRFGITANNISLGTMRTPATEAVWADPDGDVARRILRSYAIRRPGEPDDAGALAVFLAGDHGSWITGQTLPLNGGYSFAL